MTRYCFMNHPEPVPATKRFNTECVYPEGGWWADVCDECAALFAAGEGRMQIVGDPGPRIVLPRPGDIVDGAP